MTYRHRTRSGMVALAVLVMAAFGTASAQAQAVPHWVATCHGAGQANITAGPGSNGAPFYVPGLGGGLGAYTILPNALVECTETDTTTGLTVAPFPVNVQAGNAAGWWQNPVPGVCGLQSTAGTDVGPGYPATGFLGAPFTGPWNIKYHIDFNAGSGTIQILNGSVWGIAPGGGAIQGAGTVNITPVPGPQTPFNNVCAEAIEIAGSIQLELM